MGDTLKQIDEKAREIYKDRYGKRNPASLSSQEIERVRHDAAVQVQKERKDREAK